MASAADDRIAGMVTEQLNSARRNSEWFLVLGIVQIVAGMLAVGFAFTATLASVMMIGVLLFIAAGTQITAALLARDWDGFFLFLALGSLYPAVGFLTLHYPLGAAEGPVLMLTAGYMVGGMFRIIIAFVEGFPSWNWIRLNGIITMLLGLAICGQWPYSGLPVFGLLIGIDLVVNGMIWSMLALGVHILARL
jgi:uncharacterized membrane protein HdeD (DUF308 family)